VGDGRLLRRAQPRGGRPAAAEADASNDAATAIFAAPSAKALRRVAPQGAGRRGANVVRDNTDGATVFTVMGPSAARRQMAAKAKEERVNRHDFHTVDQGTCM